MHADSMHTTCIITQNVHIIQVNLLEISMANVEKNKSKVRKTTKNTIKRDFSAIPEILRKSPRWCVWAKPDEGGKLPFRVINGRAWNYTKLGKCNDPSTWTTFEKAMSCYDNCWEYIDGVAIALGYCDVIKKNIAGIDYDDCLDENNRLHKDVDMMMSAFYSYRERSQSGRGYKDIVFGTIDDKHLIHTEKKTGRQFKNIPCDGMATEVYHKGRFFFLTGEGIGEPIDSDKELNDMISLLQEIKDAGKPKVKHKHKALKDTPQYTSLQALSDDDLIERIEASKQGDKFNNLMAGNIAGYESYSEADFALTSMLNWWTNNNVEQVERIFSRSDLADRDKWGVREDYRDRTTRNSQSTGGYNPRSLDMNDARRRARKMKENKDV